MQLACASVGIPLGIIVTPASTVGATVGKKKFGEILGSEEGGKLDEQGGETVGVKITAQDVGTMFGSTIGETVGAVLIVTLEKTVGVFVGNCRKAVGIKVG